MKDGVGPPHPIATTDPSGETPPSDPADRKLRWLPARLRSRRMPSRTTALVLGVVTLLVAALVVTNLRIAGGPTVSPAQVDQTVNQGVKGAVSQVESQPPTAMKVYEEARNGLVVVQALSQSGSSQTADQSLGAGVVVDAQGDILTALHVVKGMMAIKVTFSDGTSSAASIKSTDPKHDIAVLTAVRQPAILTPAILGGSPQVGQEAYAIGNPLGLVSSLSSGVISGVNRSFRVAGGSTLSGMIQFDAAVNPGSSGGPLLNAQGQVIGIVEGLANAAGTEQFSGIGFAVPIDQAGQAAGAPPK